MKKSLRLIQKRFKQRINSKLNIARKAISAAQKQKALPRSCGCGREVPKHKQHCMDCRSARIKASRRRSPRQPTKHRRRARKYGCYYVPFQSRLVFERDNWTCQICKRAVARKWDHANPLSPELDHIIPMSKRGPHTPENTQCSCRECNGRKGDSLQAIVAHADMAGGGR